MCGYDNDTVIITNDDIAGKDRNIPATDRAIDLDRFIVGQVGRAGRTI